MQSLINRVVEKLILDLFPAVLKWTIEAILLISTMEFFNNSNLVNQNVFHFIVDIHFSLS
ncbi:hypothetical protein B1J93_00365 [Leptospira kirschneri serovar Pomona]|uniref:Uncharacterized protein n=1 Tax=Leptospira kirschneri serovar Pomona TaxID=561005 RepID=A0A1T1E4S9_9LEPT|nr:hypothetical protein B1J93_00365 [Leptospira kirschneri serovar Pomona]